MSKKPQVCPASRLDLLVRIRYLNPLPPPPCPPKLFDVPTDIARLGEPSYLSQLASSTPLPMLVDSEMGMPLNLNEFDGVWDGDDSAVCPQDSAADMDPEDAVLLTPSSTAVNGFDKPPTAAEVSWMRSSNLFMRKTQSKRKEGGSALKDENVDASEAAQLMAIDKTFTDLYNQNPLSVKHPDEKKRGLHVIESYDILPDDDCFNNSYIMIRFPERPTGATTAMATVNRPSSPRLQRALLRPHQDEEGVPTVEQLIPRDEDVERFDDVYASAVGLDVLAEVERIASEQGADADAIDEILPNIRYNQLRTYETVSRMQPEKEVLLGFQEEVDAREKKRRKGAYYTNVYMRTLLKKTRAKLIHERREEIQEQADRWDQVRVGYRTVTEEEKAARVEQLSLLRDPTWANAELRQLHDGYNDAEGLGEAIKED